MILLWDERNLVHLAGRDDGRGISPSDVEEVVRDPASVRRRLRGGRRAYRGTTAGGRRLAVIVEVQGRSCLRPRTAWEVTR